MSLTSDADRFALLAAVGEVADGTRLLGETVQRLLDIIVPAFADVATLDVGSATGEMRRLGARVEGPRRPDLEAALLRRHQSGDPSIGVLRALTTGASQLLAPITEPDIRALATSADDYGVLSALNLHATMYVPLRARGRTLGALACSTCSPERLFTREDQAFADALGSRIGLALDNAGLSEAVAGLERRLEATIANLAAGVIVRDSATRTVVANAAVAQLLGAASVEEVFSSTPQDLMERLEAFTEDGRRLTLEDLPSTRALRGERPPPLVARSVVRSTGRVRWLLHQATPVVDDDGRLALVVNTVEDITEAKRAERAQRLLAEAGRALASSLDYEQTLQRVAQLAVPGFADWCGVSIVAGRHLEQVAVAHVDPAKVALARAFGERFPASLDNPAGAAQVVRTGEPQFVESITPELLDATAATDEQRALVAQLAMRSIMIVPLALPEREPFGVLSLVMAESGRTFHADELPVAQELARRAAVAVENARLYTERSRVATTLQHGLLPPELPDIPGFRIATLYEPAGESTEVGGDFYDAFPVPGGWMVVVGDVTGHGAQAAALTALSRHTLRTAGRILGDAVAAIRELNAALLDLPELSLVSVCCAVVREEPSGVVADVVLAGHPPPYHVREGEPEAVGISAQLLGLDDGGQWETCRVELGAGGLLVLYTDGVLDASGSSDRFGEARLAATLRGADGAGDVIRRIVAALTRFADGPRQDDTAVLAVERVPAAELTPAAGDGDTEPVAAV